MERTKILVTFFTLLLFGGAVAHFISTDFFVNALPQWVPNKKELVYVTGILEGIAGLLFVLPATRRLGATFIMLLLISYVPVHVYVCMHGGTPMDIPVWGAWLRLTLQFVFIYLVAQFRMVK